METSKIVEFIEESFLKPLVEDKNITDISFNGKNIFYQSNINGRNITDILINQTEARNFIRQISNLTEQQFSYQNPILDVSAGKYRINAVHQSIGRANGEDAVTFSIRIASEELRINEKSEMMTPELVELFDVLLQSHQSIVIGGITGVGKTELQKYLLTRLKQNERVVVIDNVLELEQMRNKTQIDMNSWQFDEKNSCFSLQNLIKNALRSNPDWLIVAEARGPEMNEILNSALTGHPIITTVHAYSVETITNRVVRLIMMADKKTDYQDIQKDVFYHFHYFIHLNKTINEDGSIKRYIDAILEEDDDGKQNIIYKDNKGKKTYNKITKQGLTQLDFKSDSLFAKTFGGKIDE